ncbi:MAG: hypothetical protein ABEJ05_10845 [Haloglomus sp.]
MASSTDDADEQGGDAGGKGDDAGDEREGDADTAHLDGVEDGSGCMEVWEHLSEERSEDGDEDEGDGDANEQR